MPSTFSDILEPRVTSVSELACVWISPALRALLMLILATIAIVPALSSASVGECRAIVAILTVALCVRFCPKRSLDNERRDLWCGWLWGVSIPLLPLLGGAAILAVSVGMVCLVGALRVQIRRAVWLAPLACMAAGAVIAEVARLAPEYFGAVAIADFRRAQSAVGGFLLTHAHSWRYLSHLLMFGLVVALFESVPLVFHGVRRGVALGVVCAAVVTIAQSVELLTGILPNQTAFWSGINRLSGTFSDPNAQGVFLTLAPFLIFAGREWREAPRWSMWLLCGLIVCAGLLSGSRSFVLGAMLALLVGGWMLSRQAVFLLVLVGCVFVAGISILDLYTPWFEHWLSSGFIPEGGRRVLMTLSLARVSESFFSRGVFFLLGYELFDHFPLFGVGIDQFRYYVPAVVERLGLNMSDWVDNSNNFYLGLLTELGLLGTLIFVLTVRGRTLTREGGALCLLGLFVLAAILVTGPHLDFSEVLFISAGLVAAATRPRTIRALHTVTFACVGLLVGSLGVFTRELGGYQWESRNGTFDQWLSPAAIVSVACSCDGIAELALESSYVPTTSPLVVSVHTKDGEVRELSFAKPETQKVTFSCANAASRTRDHHPGSIALSITTAPGWSPARAWPGKTTDMRTLGIRMRNRRWEDLLGPPRCMRDSVDSV